MMEIRLTNSIRENYHSTVVDETANTATEVTHLWYRAMLGFGYQPESILDAMEAVLEEYRDDEEGT